MYFRKMTLVCFGILAFSACSNGNKNAGIQASGTRTKHKDKDQIGLTGYVFQPYIPGDSLIGVSHVGHEPSLDQHCAVRKAQYFPWLGGPASSK